MHVSISFFMCYFITAWVRLATMWLLCFFIKHHVHDDELPTEKSKTSLPMKWNQPPRKAVTPACANEMTFIKPSHGDIPRAESSQLAHRSTFEPHHSEHCTLHKESLDRLLARIEKSVPPQDYNNSGK